MLKPADPAFAASLAALLPEGSLSVPQARHIDDPRGRWTGQGTLLALPRTVDEVAIVVRACAQARVGIVPWGGGTGLVGGQVMAQGAAPVILSLERMTAIRAVYPAENVMIVEAGVILADVQAAATAAGRLFPLSLASGGTARIGGTLATNAGGVTVLRYGNARDLCLGLEVVLPEGAIWHGLKRLRKDNTGYDLRNLLIGSEGTLGVITAASLRMYPVPAEVGAAFLVVRDPAAALELLSLAQAQLSGGITAFELIHRRGLEFLRETMPEVRQPFAGLPEWMVLVDLGLDAGPGSGSGPGSVSGPGQVVADALSALFAAGQARGLVSDGVIATSLAQRDQFWALREAIPLANRRIGAISSHDISLPLGEIAGFIPRAGAALAALGDWRINCFGHLGDGNLHYNVFPQKGKTRADHETQREAIKTCVHDLVHELGGSVSAEHGIGRLKVGDLERYGDPAKLAAMRAIKTALDPLGIMNPGAVLRMT